MEKGYQSEMKLDFYLHRMALSTQMVILQDIRLPAADGQTFFQIDSLLLTPYFGFIIDVKSQAGQFIFQHNARKFHYQLHGTKYGMKHPVSQVEEQEDQLINWLGGEWSKYTMVSVTALADPGAEVMADASSEWVYDRVMPFDLLKIRLKEASGNFIESFFQMNQLVEVGRRLAKAHCKPVLYYWKKFDLQDRDVARGVLCPFCNRLGMTRLRVIWECPHCGGRDRHAHLLSLFDYFVFVKPTMTNKECRDFLGIRNVHTARTLLNNCGILDWKGENRGRVYFLKKR